MPHDAGELPTRLTYRWLRSLPDEDLRRVEAQLYADTPRAGRTTPMPNG